MSRSWTRRSRTTSTSSARGTNTPRRCASMNFTSVTSGRTAATAGLKRSMCPDLQDAALRPREGDEPVRLGERRGDGLLDHHVGAPREELLGHLRVRGGRRRDDDRASSRVEKLPDGAPPHEAPGPVRESRSQPRRRRPSSTNPTGLRARELGQYSRVVPAEIAAPDDACPDFRHAGGSLKDGAKRLGPSFKPRRFP